jgi:hypothetical protein
MQYLYSGGTHSLELSGNDADVLELMAAASFFQLEGLLRYTEARCAEIIDIDNVVAMYIHAKVSSDTFSVLLSPRHSRFTGLECPFNFRFVPFQCINKF